MQRKNLTDRYIKAVKPAEAGARIDHFDSLVPGLALRVTDNGHKSFVLHGRFPRKPTTYTRRAIGNYVATIDSAEQDGSVDLAPGPVSLSQARARARRWQELVAAKIDPEWEIARQKRALIESRAHTFGTVAEAFLAEVAAKWAKGREARAVFDQHFLPTWRDLPIGEIKAADCSRAIKAIAARGKAHARNCYSYLSSMFTWAIASGVYGLESSPMGHLKPKAVIGTSKVARTRVLNGEAGEIARVWAAADAAGYPYGPLTKLLLLTGQRLNEVAQVQWREFKLEPKAKAVWTIPAARMKMDRAHVVPLCPDALGLLLSLPRHNAGDFVFSTTAGLKPVNGFSKAKTRIDKLIADDGHRERLAPWVFHDLRRTLRTNLSSFPSVDEKVRELVIAHVKKGLDKSYDQFGYIAEKREALLLWERCLRPLTISKTRDR
jgi:integrase